MGPHARNTLALFHIDGRITLRRLLGMRLPQSGGLKEPTSAKETETNAWRLKPDIVETWEMVELATVKWSL